MLDDAAVASCSVYVDLNQLRAGLADSLEESQYSAICRRILAAKQREAEASREEFAEDDPDGLYAFSQAEAETLYADCWLSPITADGPLLTADSLRLPSLEPSRALDVRPESSQQAVVEQDTKVDEGKEEVGHRSRTGWHPPRRVTHRIENPPSAPVAVTPTDAATSVGRGDYGHSLARVSAGGEGGGRAHQHGPAAAPPLPLLTAGEQLEEVLTRWGVNPQAWLVQLEHLDNRCTRALGAAHRMAERAAEVAQRWLQGIRLCREIFTDTDTDTNPPGASSDEFT